MAKSGLIVPLCFFWVSGCVLFGDPDVTSEQEAVATPVAESEAVPAVTSVQTLPPETRVASARNFTREEVRAMQLRLRDVGLDPGPIDGLSGAKTKAAFARFQSGCSKIKPLMENAFEGREQPVELNQAVARLPSRQETQTIQAQLRDAGFNPGPIDGIFGNRTRSVLAHLKAGCPVVNDFAPVFERPVGENDKRVLASQPLENGSTKLQSLTPAGRSDATRQATAPTLPAPPQEDIRILQLRLRDAGFDPGPFDGVMGPKTKAALQQYQVTQREKKVQLPLITGTNDHY
jgi:peptidoglycan hydrolase-like protein with peptidoglycan-binding domain